MWNDIVAWQRELMEEELLSPRTIALYAQDVRRFASWMMGVRRAGQQVGPADITVEDALAYRAYLVERSLSRSTINRAITALRLFFAAGGKREDSPFHTVPTVPRRNV